MRKPSLKGGLFFIAVWLSFFLLLRQLDPGGSLLSRLLAIPLPLFALTLTGAGAGLDGALCFSRRAWRLADTPIARIRPAPQGYIELYGRARLLAAGATDPRPTQQPSLCLVSLPNRGAVLRRTLVVGGIWRPRQSIALDDGTAQCVIDPDEWEAVRRAAHRQVQRQQLQQTTQPDVHLMTDPGDSARPCIIAAFREEHRLTTYFRWRAVGCFLAMALTSGYLLWTSR